MKATKTDALFYLLNNRGRLIIEDVGAVEKVPVL